MTPDIHVYIASAQATPCILPAFDQRLKPQQLLLLHDVDTEAYAQDLKKAIQPRGVVVELIGLQDIDNRSELEQTLLALFERFAVEQDSIRVALNISSGSRLACVMAYEVFRLYGQAVFHVDPYSDILTWLYPANQTPMNLQDSIRLEAFLQAYGVSLEQPPMRQIRKRAWLSVAGQILTRLDFFADAISSFNYLAASAESTLTSVTFNQRDKALRTLIDIFGTAGVVRVEKGRLVFDSEAERFFCNGGWIEMHVFDVVRQCRKIEPQIQDVAFSLNVFRDDHAGKVRNEIDVAFLFNNRLFVIECKTMTFKGSSGKRSGSHSLYKLDTLRQVLGGINAESMLVSLKALSVSDKRRALDLGISVCAGDQLLHLKDALLRMVRG